MARGRLTAPTRGEFLALASSALALGLAWWGLGAARRAADPRGALVRQFRREAGAHDLLIITDEAPELVTEAAPLAALWGVVALQDLSGIRKLYVLAPTEPALAPYLARLGPGRPRGASAMAWDLDGTARVVFDATAEVGTRVGAHRDGGLDAGPCPPDGGALRCHGPPWNHVRVEPHHFAGVELSCVFGHPQADGRLVIELTGIPSARALVGAVGIDDAGFFPTGAAVTMRVEYRAEGRPVVSTDVVAPNRRGVTPWRLDVPPAPASATLTITTPDAGARQFCFTLQATDAGAGQRKP